MTMWPRRSEWNPFSPWDWAQALGLAYVPLFGTLSGASRSKPPGDYAVLMDGRGFSCAVFAGNDLTDLVYNPDPLSWSWSSNLKHIFIIIEKTETLFHRRWDSPGDIRVLRTPRTPESVANLFGEITKRSARSADTISQSADVISRMLKSFRQLCTALSPFTTDPVVALRVFNAFLVGTDLVRRDKLDKVLWGGCRTVGEALSLADAPAHDQIPDSSRTIPIGDILDDFLEPDQLTGRRLEPDLLIRHASGVLYQEAHFELVKGQPLLFPGMVSEITYKGALRRDVRYTPPEFARVLVEQSFRALGESNRSVSPLKILDPACGSGVFLQESLRELERRKFSGAVELTGFDNSEVSCVVARFCLDWAVRDSSPDIQIKVQIDKQDALEETIDWGTPVLILTNPPFMGWKRMDSHDHQLVRATLGDLFKGHADKSMAFVWKAMRVLHAGGVVASIIPSPLLESVDGLKWRRALSDSALLHMIGRFTGFGFFQGAVVELGFLVMRKKDDSAVWPSSVRIILADEGYEESALRATRLDWAELSNEETSGFELNVVDPGSILPISWLPRPRRSLELLETLKRSAMGRVADLFNVSQGTTTGDNNVFLLSRDEYSQLPAEEKAFFRPAAGTPTIRNCRLNKEEYIFYPYGHGGALITTEADLRSKLPFFFEKYLGPVGQSFRPVNESRHRIGGSWPNLARGNTLPLERLSRSTSEMLEALHMTKLASLS